MFNSGDTFPYIGLRPFSEDDSIYFKGRDEHILQITALLEANKFLMVTGASGDGKSSLVYAGLVPNARAGFFNSRYTNWVVSDFRPERSPLKNLSKSISRNLRIGNEESVEVELRRGFSSLVELYKSSSLYIDEQSESWINASESERDDLQRSAANLLIVTDQFEEFFTNPENYYQNSPSADSQLVINLLLETARISMERDLPIYIICTMRSDYIGQCATFRGLPEFIGFSQFFVPRLKRKEMIEVVREPAYLHGDKISNRLVERVVYDLGEGIDQLPVLEHAMNEVWIQANYGKEELDLLYYAMAGGMAGKDLPTGEREKFETWFSALPGKLQAAYHEPGLSRIIDTHANKLYLSAAERYNEKHEDKISEDDAQLLIKIAFICLTKMDEGRAVRNRMTLQEITQIIDRPHLTWELVGDVLNAFREPGNTFLRPYISDDPESNRLKPDSVLDITHESLIRNWELLTSWAQEEYDYFTVYEDFKKQLDRWLDSGKSRGFLLSIGPLTFFEGWHEKLNPNAYWINRYLDPGLPLSDRMKQARLTIEQSEEFLRKSARSHLVTRMVVRHGGKKIASVAGAIFLTLIVVYFIVDFTKKQNQNVVQKVYSEAEPILHDPRVVSANKAEFIILSEALRPGSYRRVLDGIPAALRLGVAKDVYTEFAWNANTANPPIRKDILLYCDSVLSAPVGPTTSKEAMADRFKALNMLVIQTSHYLYFYKDAQLERILKNSIADLREVLLNVLVKSVETETPDINMVDDAIEHVLNNKGFSEADIQKILASISPYEGELATRHFNRLFPLDKRVNYCRGNRYSHNGGYQQLAYLYAAIGKIGPIKASIDSLLKYNPRYTFYVDNASLIATYLFQYQHRDQMHELIQDYCAKQSMSVKEFYERWLNNCGIFEMDFSNKLWTGENHNIALVLLDDKSIGQLFDLYAAEIQKNSQGPDELHFNLALYYKHRGALLSKMKAEEHASIATKELHGLFGQAIEEYRKVGSAYLDEETPFFTIYKQPDRIKRRSLFLYPDHIQKVWNRTFLVPGYYTTAYLNYLIDSKLFSEFYPTAHEIEIIYSWLKNYRLEDGTSSTTQVEKNYTPFGEKDLVRIDSIFSLFPNERLNGAGNLAHLMLIHHYMGSHQYEKIDPIYKKLDVDKFTFNLLEPEFNSTGVQYQINSLTPLINELAAFLVDTGKLTEATEILGKYTSRNNRTIAYADASRRFLELDPKSPETIFPYYDSAVNESKRFTDFQFGATDPRIVLAYGTSAAGNKELFNTSETFVKQVSLNTQTDVVQAWIHGIAESNQYYKAYRSIPEITILSDRLMLYNMILIKEALSTSDAEMKDYLTKRNEIFYQEDYGYEFRTN